MSSFANGRYSNLEKLFAYLSPREAQYDLDVSRGATQMFTTIKPIANSLDNGQMKELCRVMFGHDDELHLNDQQKRLMKSYIEYAYPTDGQYYNPL